MKQQPVQNLLTWMHTYWRGLFYGKLYIEHLIERYRRFDTTALITRGHVQFDSQDIFVDPHLEPQKHDLISSAVLPTPLGQFHDRRYGIWDYLGVEKWSDQHFAIIAGPGFGKTAILQHIMLVLTRRNLRYTRYKVPRKLPVWLSLRELASSVAANSHTPPEKGISPDLYQRLYIMLLQCGPFNSNQELRTIFVDGRISAWRYLVRDEFNPARRVEALIDLLFRNHRMDTGENALVLFLHVIRERIDPNDGCHNDLADLASALVAELSYTSFAVSHDRSGTFNRDFTLAQAIHDTIITYAGPEEPLGWFEQKLKRGRCIVMLDGLDEIVAAGTRKQVMNWLNHQMVAYPKNRFILTSRPYGYLDNLSSRMVLLEALSFDTKQVEQFVRNWYQAVNRVEDPQEAALQPQNRVEERTQDLLKQIRETPALYALSINPLLLTMMVYVHHHGNGKVLPKRRVDLYAEIHRVLLGLRTEVPQLQPEQKQAVLQPLAYAMMMAQQQEISALDAMQIIQSALQDVQARLAGEHFLASIQHLGLMWERSQTYGFAHLTFQNYLAAIHFCQTSQVSILVDCIDNGWWHETILFYCAMEDATPVIQACLADEKSPHFDVRFRLALECLDYADNIRPDVQIYLETVLYRCLEVPERRSIINQALAYIRKKRLLPVSVDKQVDTLFISNIEYQVFLHEQRMQGAYHYPDHWLAWEFPQGQGMKPIVGIRSTDALAFCTWLNQSDETSRGHFRLPDRQDLNTGSLYSIDRSGSEGFWMAEENRYECYGYDSIVVEPAMVQHYVQIDTIEPHTYAAADLFARPAYPPDAMLHLITEFDFRREYCKKLYTYLHKTIPLALRQTIALAPRIQHIQSFFSAGIVACRDRYVQLDREAAAMTSLIQQLETQRQREHTTISARYQIEYVQIDQNITAIRRWFDDLELRRQTVHDQIPSRYSSGYAQIDQNISILHSHMNSVHQQLQQAQQSVFVYYQQQYTELDRILGQDHQQIHEVEQHRSREYADIQAHYQQQYAQLDQILAQDHQQIYEAEQHRSRAYADIQIHYQQQYAELDRMVTSNRYDHTAIEDDRARLQKAEQQNYANVDNGVNAVLKEIQQHIDDVERDRTRLQAAEQQGYASVARSVDADLREIQQHIDDIERHRRQLQDAEKQVSTSIQKQANERLAGIEAQIKQQERQRKELSTIEQRDYDEVEQRASHVRSMIQSRVDHEENDRRDIQRQEQAEHMHVDQQIDPTVKQHWLDVHHLENESGRHREEAAALERTASELQRLFANLRMGLESWDTYLETIKNVCNNYFCGGRGDNITRVERRLATLRETLSQLENIVQEASPVNEFKNQLQSLTQTIEQMQKGVARLQAIIGLSIELEDQLAQACTRVRDTELPALPITQHVHTSQNSGTNFISSFIATYEYILYRKWQHVSQPSQQDARNRLRYVRLCVLTLGLRELSKTGQEHRRTHVMQIWFDIYLKLCIIDARINGILTPFEGIRVMAVSRMP